MSWIRICGVLGIFWAALGAGAAVIEVTTLSDVQDSGVCGVMTLADLPGTDGEVSLREAMCAANNETGPHIIRMRDGLAGTIILNSPLPSQDNETTIIGSGSEALSLSGADSHRIFNFNNNMAPVTLIGLSIVDGKSTGAIGGGGIRHINDLTLINCRVANCTSLDNGGGILHQGAGTLRLENCVIEDNTVTGESKGGGGVASDTGGRIETVNSLFQRNSVTGLNAANGGALLSLPSGGAEIRQCEFRRNSVTGHGGALHFTSTDPSRPLRVVDSTFHTNTALGDIIGDGGGLVINGAASLTNTTIFANLCDRNGGGVFVAGGVVRFTHCTITQNYCDFDSTQGGDGGGLARSAGTVELRNTLIANNVNIGGDTPDLSGLVFSLGYNLIGNVGTTNFENNAAGDIYGDPGSTTTPNTGAMESPNAVNPLIAPIQDNGGGVPTAALMPNSPAVNAGNNDFVTAPYFDAPPFTDARGEGFDRIVGGTADIGAFESDGATIPVILVNTSQDTFDYRFYGGLETTLREAILLAPAGAIVEFGGGAVSLLNAVNIRLGSSPSEFEIVRDLTIRGPGADRLVLNAEDARRIMTISGAAQVEISGLGFINGLVTGDGGAIQLLDTASLTISDCEIINCRASDDGGGISNEGSGALIVRDCLIDSCRAIQSGHDGGGISNKGAGATLIITGSTIRNCQTTGGMGSSGAGVYHIAIGALLQIRDSEIAHNTSDGAGSGVFCQFGNAEITGTAIYGNVSNQTNFGGGGILVSSPSTVSIANSTISGNRAKDFGGGMRISGNNASVTLTNVTITGNIADDNGDGVGGGGGLIFISGELRLRNTLIAGNIDRNGLTPDVQFEVLPLSDGHNLIGDLGQSNFASNTTGDQYGDPNDLTTPNAGALESPTAIDPLITQLQFNGGLTPTHAPRPGSPVVDAGDNAFVLDPPFDGPPFFDQRGEGFPRILDGDNDETDRVDIGAHEATPGESPSIVVSSLEDDSDGNYLHGFLTLREAILIAPSGGLITFHPDLDGTIIVNSQLVIAKHLNIYGPGADVITVRGAGNVRCLYVEQGNGVVIDGLRFTHGNSAAGGAIHNRGNMVLFECAFLENQTSTFGGAIYNRGVMNIHNCLIQDNQSTAASDAGGGGGVANYDAGAGASLTINNSTLAGNMASMSVGGGVFNFGDGAMANAHTQLINTTISDCHAAVGGGVFNSGADALVTAIHTTIVKGSGLSGGGLFNDNGAGLVHLKNCLFADNTSLGNDDVSNNVTANYCLFEDGSTVVTGANNIIGQDPMLLDLATAGGLWPVHALHPDSPAIDTITSTDTLPLDARGMARPVDGDGDSAPVADVGAFEFSPYIFVAGDVGFDEDGGTDWIPGPGLEGPVKSIERGLELATFGSEVWVKRGVYFPRGNRRVGEGLGGSTVGTIILKSGVALRGGFEGTELPGAILPPFDPNLTVIDGSIAFDGEPAWHVVAMVGTQDACMHDLTVTGGRALGHPLLGGQVAGGVVVLTSTSACGLNNCVIRDNWAETLGGGVAIGENCALPLNSCTVINNEAGPTGGGGVAVFNADVTVTSCTIANNSAGGDGGGLWARQARVTVTNSTISGNSAGRHGGGVMVFENLADVNLNFTTITGNTASAGGDASGDGGGVFFDHVGSLTIGNSIIAGNTDAGGETPDLAAGGAASQGYNLIGNLGLAAFANNTTGDQYGDPLETANPAPGALETAGVINAMLGPLTDYGGPTWTHMPLPGSPAIDAADPNAIVLTTDQRGQPRPFDGDGADGPRHDIGAVERQDADNYSPATFYYIY